MQDSLKWNWVIKDLTKREVRQSEWNVVLSIQKVLLQGFGKISSVWRLPGSLPSVPAETVWAVFCNVKVKSTA